MAYDGIFMSHIVGEIEKGIGSRVDKIYMPTRDDIVITLSGKSFSGKLLITLSSVGPRVHFTKMQFENPLTPPMFCMLMRKHFSSARLERVRQNGLDRALFLDFSSFNELGDAVELTIAVEIMGRQSNVILISNGRIIDALHRTDLETAGRLILSGAQYELPPSQDKADLRESDLKLIEAKVNQSGLELSKALSTAVEGVSPLVAREIALYAQMHGLTAALERLKGFICTGTPTMLVSQEQQPYEFTYMPIEQYGTMCDTRVYDTFSELCDAFYSQRQKSEIIRRRTYDLTKLVTILIERTARKIEKQKGELSRCKDKEQLRIYGELIKANLYSIERGAPYAEVSNYYTEDCSVVRIPLKTELSPSQNAQRYFTEYRKANTAEEMLTGFIEKSTNELEYLESVLDELSRAQTERELSEIRNELCESGYIRIKGQKNSKPPKALPPLHFVSSDGFDIYVGRNNKQNDELTLRTAAKSDLWFHTKHVHGTHTIVSALGSQVPESTVLEAAMLAAYHSKARQSGKVAVDYCKVKNVKKPSGAKPGMVIYDNYETVFVTPDAEQVEKLSKNQR